MRPHTPHKEKRKIDRRKLYRLFGWNMPPGFLSRLYHQVTITIEKMLFSNKSSDPTRRSTDQKKKKF